MDHPYFFTFFFAASKFDHRKLHFFCASVCPSASPPKILYIFEQRTVAHSRQLLRVVKPHFLPQGTSQELTIVFLQLYMAYLRQFCTK